MQTGCLQCCCLLQFYLLSTYSRNLVFLLSWILLFHFHLVFILFFLCFFAPACYQRQDIDKFLVVPGMQAWMEVGVVCMFPSVCLSLKGLAGPHVWVPQRKGERFCKTADSPNSAMTPLCQKPNTSSPWQVLLNLSHNSHQSWSPFVLIKQNIVLVCSSVKSARKIPVWDCF